MTRIYVRMCIHAYITLNKVALRMTMDDFTTVAACPPLHPYVSMPCPHPIPHHKPVSLPSLVFIKITTSEFMSISLTQPPTHAKTSLPTSQVSSEGLITKRKLRTYVKPTLQIIGSYFYPRQRAGTSKTSWHEVGWLEVEMVHRIRQRTNGFLHSCIQKWRLQRAKVRAQATHTTW